MIYLDNCSTTHTKPKSVIKAINLGLTKYNYNPGRAGYKNAIKTNLQVLKLRETASKFFGLTNSNNVIITKSCTESLNIAIKSNPKPNGHIIATIFEHNSVLRVLEYMKQTFNITYTLLKPNNNGIIDTSSIEKSIKPNTYMLIINHISNVVGFVQNIENFGQICKRYNLIFIVDGAQSAGHHNINMEKMGINYLAIAGHKGTFGPQGIGLLLCNNQKPTPYLYGGTGTYSENLNQPTDLPEGLESGTMSVSNIMGLTAGIEYVTKNQKHINEKIKILTKYLIQNLSKLDNVILYSNKNSLGVVAFNIKGYTSNEVSQILDKYGFETRSGLHCAPKVHEYFKTLNTGMVRIGISHFNTIKELKKLINTIKLVGIN